MYFYPAIHSIGRDTKFTVAFFIHSLFIIYGYRFLSRGFTDPIGVKFCMAVQPHLGQVFSHFGGIIPGMAKLWASTGAMWRDMLLAEALVQF